MVLVVIISPGEAAFDASSSSSSYDMIYCKEREILYAVNRLGDFEALTSIFKRKLLQGTDFFKTVKADVYLTHLKLKCSISASITITITAAVSSLAVIVARCHCASFFVYVTLHPGPVLRDSFAVCSSVNNKNGKEEKGV